MFGFLKRIMNGRKKSLSASVKEYQRRQEEYIQMKKEQLSLLSDDELFDAVFARVHYAVDSYENMMVGVRSVTSTAKVFFVASYYEMEVNNGGLCQFFINSGRAVAPSLSACLGEIGAEEHRAHFDRFVSENGIDVKDLSSFIIEDVNEYEAQTKRYDFDAFDQRFYEMKPICEYLSAYARANITVF